MPHGQRGISRAHPPTREMPRFFCAAANGSGSADDDLHCVRATGSSSAARQTRSRHGRGRAREVSASQGAALVAHAVADAPDPKAANSLVALMESLSDEPLYKDNACGLLVDGPATYDAMFAAVHAARRYIHCEMYIIGDDEVGRTFAKLLVTKHNKAWQSGCSTTASAAGRRRRFLRPNARSRHRSDRVRFGESAGRRKPVEGEQPRPSQDPDRRRRGRVHRRVEHRQELLEQLGRDPAAPAVPVPGRRFGTKKPERGWRDTDVVIQGPAVTGFVQLFRENWERSGGVIPGVVRRRHAARPGQRTRPSACRQ